MATEIHTAEGVESYAVVDRRVVKGFFRAIGIDPEKVQSAEVSLYSICARVFAEDERGNRVSLPDGTDVTYEVDRLVVYREFDE